MKARKQLILITLFFIFLFSGPAIAAPCLFEAGSELAELHRWINKFRVSEGQSELECETRIVDAASEHSEQMCLDGRLHHDRFGERIDAIGIPWVWAGEIVAYNSGGPGSARQAVEQWENSAPHRAIMLEANRFFGGGIEECGARTYFTVIFLNQ